jgi:hypothetical protein
MERSASTGCSQLDQVEGAPRLRQAALQPIVALQVPAEAEVSELETALL